MSRRSFIGSGNMTSHAVIRWGLVLALLSTSWSSGCRSPRDPDLDRRMEEATITRALPAPAEEAPAATAPTAKAADEGAKYGLPPAGSVELRTYSESEIKAIYAAVPRAPGTPKDAQDLTYRATLETGEGKIRCLLDHAHAPQTVANFIALATNQRPWRDPDTKEVAKGKFYDGLTFHRAITDFIIQTGQPGTGASSGPGWSIAREPGLATRYDDAGAMGMVDSGDDSHGSQFFITLRGQASLKGKYTPFGLCEDLDTIRQIANGEKQPPSTAGKSATKPVTRVRLDRIRVVATAVSPPTTTATPENPPGVKP